MLSKFFKSILVAVPLIAGGFVAYASDSEDCARIDLNAEKDGLTITVLEKSQDCGTKKQNWGSTETRDQRLTIFPTAAKDIWTSSWITFKTDKDGTVKLSLLGPWIPNDSKQEPVWIEYDEISAEGAELKDGSFEDGKAWSMSDENKISGRDKALSGSKSVKAWHNKSVSQTIFVKANHPVTLRFNCRKYNPDAKYANDDKFLDLSKVANMALKDEKAGDGQGGWSDQGPENDFATLDIERNFFANVPFKLINPAKNSNKAVLVFSSKNLSSTISLKEAQVDASGISASYLYILHTMCWGSKDKKELVGKIEVTLKNGSKKTFDVVNGVDITDWWKPVDLTNAIVAYEKDNKQASVGIYVSRFKISDKPEELASVKLIGEGGSGIWIVLGLTASNKDYPKPTAGIVTFKADDVWKVVNTADINVKKGSALDLSDMIDDSTCGSNGRVIVNPEGKLAFEKEPTKPVRFIGCSIHLDIIGKMDKDGIETYAEQIRIQGYNLVRFHFPEFFLMKNAKKELELDPESLDKMFYFVKCLRNRGIYLYFDIVTSWSAYMPGTGWGDAAKNMHLKSRIYTESAVRAHWEKVLNTMLGTENPYTGLKLADDPAIAAILFFNEQEITFIRDEIDRPGTDTAWQKWLRHKYEKPENLAKAWKLDSVDFEQQKFQFQYLQENTTGQKSIDAALFIADLESSLLKFFNTALKKTGYKGLTSQFDANKCLEMDYVKRNMDLIVMHAYYAHPSKFIHNGSTMSQRSSLEKAADYWRHFAGTRYLGKAYFVTEYGHVQWNRYRYEEGFVMGAYSSFQGFDGLMVHATPVDTKVEDPMRPFWIARDPIGRASQVITQHLFIRQDVKPADKSIAVILNHKSVFEDGNAMQNLDKQSELALMTGFGICWDKIPEKINDKVEACALYNRLPLLRSIPETSAKEYDSAAAFNYLKNSRILPGTNKSNFEKGIYETSTGEVALDKNRKIMRVSTKRFEGVSFVTPEPFALPSLTVTNVTVPSSIALMSRTEKPLAETDRMLLAISTDAVNSDSVYNTNRTIVINNGKLPVLMQTGLFEFEIACKDPERFEVWALGLDGSRKELIKSSVSGGKLVFSINTAELKDGPTPFFEIKEKSSAVGKLLGF